MITVKKGDTLSFIVKRDNEAGEPMTGDAAKLKSQIRTKKDELIANFTITETDVLGEYLFVVPAAITNTLIPGIYLFDIEYTDDDIVKSSDTMEIQVIKDVTRDD